MTSKHNETIKLLFDWNKWLVAVETAAIAALGFITKDGANSIVLVLGTLTIFIFVAAIGLSSFFLLNLPYLMEESGEQSDEFLGRQRVKFLWAVQRYRWWPGEKESWRVGKFTSYITRLFLTGIVFFALTFAAVFIPENEIKISPNKTLQSGLQTVPRFAGRYVQR